MKKLFYLLFVLPLAFFASCDDDDDMAQVDLTLTLNGVTLSEGDYYAVQGDTIKIDGVNVKSLTNQAATVTGVRYFFDGYPVFGSIEHPFNCSILTTGIDSGTHTLSLTATILQVDKSITSAAVNFPVKIVDNKESLPADAPEIGTYSQTVRLQAK
jgi:hypothetical protein